LKDTTSDKMTDLMGGLMFWPMDLADRLIPAGPWRFLGYVFAFPLSLVLGLPLAAPVVLASFFVIFWEMAHDERFPLKKRHDGDSGE
jgi:hypothetical protein